MTKPLLRYPVDFPSEFACGLDELASRNRHLVSECQRLIHSFELKDFWRWADEKIESFHSSEGTLLGSVQGWKQGFINDVFLALFAPQIANGETVATRAERRKDISRTASKLARLLKQDQNLLTGFGYHLRNTKPHPIDVTHAFRVISLDRDLEEFAKFAVETPIEPHPFESPKPGAKHGHVNQKARHLRHVFLTCTGDESWGWIKRLLEIAEEKEVGNVQYRVRKNE